MYLDVRSWTKCGRTNMRLHEQCELNRKTVDRNLIPSCTCTYIIMIPVAEFGEPDIGPGAVRDSVLNYECITNSIVNVSGRAYLVEMQ